MKKSFIIFILFIISLNSPAQEILLTVADKQISDNEFIRMYKKSNAAATDKMSVDEYLELFINFKLKVIEAENRGYQNEKNFKQEFNNFKDILSKPYLIDTQKKQELMKQAYNRLKTEIRTHLILIAIGKFASDNDTALAFEKATRIRNRIIAGEKFESVARTTSDMRYASQNGGDIWYISALQLPYQVENYIYTAPVKSVSMPIRTDAGYVIAMASDKRKNKGRIKVAHIMIIIPANADSLQKKAAKDKIFAIYDSLTNGADFAVMTKKYSQDNGTAQNGGELPWFGTGEMVPEFETAAFNLTYNGQISKPIRTQFGWHIIKRIDVKPIGTFDQEKNLLEKRFEKSDRYQICVNSFAEKLKNKYNFTDYNAIADIYTICSDIASRNCNTDSLFYTDKPMFSFADKDFYESQFIKYLSQHPLRNHKADPIKFINYMYNEFIKTQLINYEKENLEKNNKEYSNLLKEYYEGLLLFEISNKEIWSATIDTSKLFDFYSQHKNKYIEPEKLDISVFYYANSKSKDELISKLTDIQPNSKAEQYIEDFNPDIHLELTGIFAKGQNKYADMIFDNKKVKKYRKDKRIYIFEDENKIIFLNKKYPEKIAKFNDVKTKVIEDYQNFTEKEFTNKLRKKYKISVNKEVLKKIKKLNDLNK